jgi:membrane-associated phospholipid phosphatase
VFVPLLVGKVHHNAPVGFVVAHAALLAAAIWVIARPTPRWTLWLPMAAIPFLYAELPFLMPAFGGGLHDSAVQSWDAGIFGLSPAITLAGRLPLRILSEILHGGYLSYYVLIYGPPLVAWKRCRDEAFEAAVAGVMWTFLICCVVFVVWPVAGPRFLWPAPSGIPSGPIRAFTLLLLQAGSSRGAAFPSSHVAVAVTQTLIALRYQRTVGVVCAVCSVLITIGAVYAGFHYGVDVIAGVALGAVVGGLVLFRGRDPRE